MPPRTRGITIRHGHFIVHCSVADLERVLLIMGYYNSDPLVKAKASTMEKSSNINEDSWESWLNNASKDHCTRSSSINSEPKCGPPPSGPPPCAPNTASSDSWTTFGDLRGSWAPVESSSTLRSPHVNDPLFDCDPWAEHKRQRNRRNTFADSNCRTGNGAMVNTEVAPQTPRTRKNLRRTLAAVTENILPDAAPSFGALPVAPMNFWDTCVDALSQPPCPDDDKPFTYESSDSEFVEFDGYRVSKEIVDQLQNIRFDNSG